jgi:SAM-dependent methyltransferase
LKEFDSASHVENGMNPLDVPLGYLGYQWVVGGVRARKRCLQDHVRFNRGMRVLDVGCGPGYVAKWLAGTEYVGLDTDRKYIEYASKHYRRYGEFHCSALTADFLKKRPSFDYVLMNGVLHHLSDDVAGELLEVCHDGLKSGGALVTLDGFYADDIHPVAHFLLVHDRGKFIRTRPDYLRLVLPLFSSVKSYEHRDYFNIPYSVLVMECRREK